MSEVTRRKYSNTAILHEFQSYLRKFHRIVSLVAGFRQSPCTSTTWLPQGALKARGWISVESGSEVLQKWRLQGPSI